MAVPAVKLRTTKIQKSLRLLDFIYFAAFDPRHFISLRISSRVAL